MTSPRLASLDADELDIFINDAESLVHAQKKSAVESIEEFESYTAEEIEKDCNDMKAITGAYKKDNPNDPDFVKLAEKKLSQWSEDNKPNIRAIGEGSLARRLERCTQMDQ